MPTGRGIYFSSLKGNPQKKKTAVEKVNPLPRLWENFPKSSILEMIEGYVVIFQSLRGREKLPKVSL